VTANAMVGTVEYSVVVFSRRFLINRRYNCELYIFTTVS
jgi:hypothetical protein